MLDSSYPQPGAYSKNRINDAGGQASLQPIPAASERLENALFQLHARLEVLATKLTPVLHSQPPQPTANESAPASDVGLVRQLDDATAGVQQAVRAVDDLIDRTAV